MVVAALGLPPFHEVNVSFVFESDPSVVLPATVPELPVRRLSVEQYHQMLHGGILQTDDRVELLEGLLVDKMTKHPPHSAATRLTRAALEKLVPAGWYVDSQEPVTTADSEPEPDVCIIRGARRDYVERHPGPADVGLLIEVADESLVRDRGVKKRLYARAGIPVYWIVNLIDRQVEVFSEPLASKDLPDYRHQRVCGGNGAVPLIVAGVEIGQINVADLLP
jgi:Uma2 family endonuclease